MATATAEAPQTRSRTHAVTTVLHVGGLHYASEKAVVEGVLGHRPGVLAVEANAEAMARDREYDFVTRLVMRLMMCRRAAQVGSPGGEEFTDMKHDHELTDWEAVDEFARAFALTLTKKPSPVQS